MCLAAYLFVGKYTVPIITLYTYLLAHFNAEKKLNAAAKMVYLYIWYGIDTLCAYQVYNTNMCLILPQKPAKFCVSETSSMEIFQMPRQYSPKRFPNNNY